MITAADIDVTIPGEVASVDAAAQWLEGLRDNAEDANGLLNAAALTEISSGEVSAAVTSYALTLWQCSMDVYVRATDAADVNRAFADQLGWRKDDMKEHLETARGDGLTVIGNIIKFPTEVPFPGNFPWLAAKAVQAAWFAANQAYLEYLKKLRDFEKIKGRVEATFKQLNDWIVNNLVKAKEKAMETLRDGALKSLILNSSKYGITNPKLLGNKFTPMVTQLRAVAQSLESARRSASSAGTRSKPPSKHDIDQARKSVCENFADDLEATGDKAKRFAGRVVDVAGPVSDLVAGSPLGETVVSTAAGTAVALALGSEGPAVAVVAAPAVAGIGAVWGYRELAPLENREYFEYPWSQFKDGMKNAVGDAKNWAGGAADDVKNIPVELWCLGFEKS